MRYVIRYDGGEVIRERPRGRGLWIAALMVLLAVAVRLVWPNVADWAGEALFSGGSEQTVAAFGEMLEALRSGAGFSQAVTAFCQEVMAGAGF